MNFVIHENPVLRSRSNYIARADLTPFGFGGQVEQLWLMQCEDDSFELCCIPFRVYGMSLNDRVRLSDDGSLIAGLVAKSGRRVLRVLLTSEAGQLELTEGISRIKSEVTSSGLLNEWSGDRHIAIDVPAMVDVTALMQVIEREEEAGVAFWEWGDSLPFSA
ncbi:DUF4265 domain-containing protein [Solihabitans fulvus]|uniref:DUF4265 domain-containing protein n=1 Tax=Solihabitans fulvus TaxID=1892852 RepID=A0A5B2WN57_9PSEU|nr:DUF4265 domain-containing protein [Solihabitans fulvus]KAA2252388.1 DUF4265 domain-containing protein [Solihabitans fulvus]